jgi:polyhydroxyalkanoate synthesis repressor PhaR
MAKQDTPTTIKKYANRRLYNTGTSTYVTLEDLAAMVKAGEDFLVYDAKTGEDITRSVLAQIIFEQEKFRKQLTDTFSGTPFAPLEEHVRRNMELFQQTFSMFKPFTPSRAGDAPKSAEPPPDDGNIDDLRKQMKEMQERLERMSKEPKKEE